MYQNIFLSIFAISWVSERIYFYYIHNRKILEPNGLLNLNAPLNNSYSAEYNPITIPENNQRSKNGELNNTENHSHL